jgi:hypothetical protein
MSCGAAAFLKKKRYRWSVIRGGLMKRRTTRVNEWMKGMKAKEKTK